MKRLGVIVNPIAGLGGRAGFKGTDGANVVWLARWLGAEPESPKRAVEALKIVSRIKESVEVIAYSGEMGEEECRAAGIVPSVIGSITSGETTPEDTTKAAEEMLAEGVNLLLFSGGDGTARNIYDVVRHKIPVIGIPSGVKIHSAVFAVNPRGAGEVAVMFLKGGLTKIRVSEVMDIDECAFRNGKVVGRVYGTMRVPEEARFVQSAKCGGIQSEREALQGIVASVVELMEDSECYFIIGSGTTTKSILDALGLEKTLLGVDIVRNKALLAKDVSEYILMDFIRGKKSKIVVTVIGGQGHVFGRGNQQISPRVIRETGRENIVVVATKEKLASLGGKPLLVDTGDETLDRELTGYIKVITGYWDYLICKLQG